MSISHRAGLIVTLESPSLVLLERKTNKKTGESQFSPISLEREKSEPIEKTLVRVAQIFGIDLSIEKDGKAFWLDTIRENSRDWFVVTNLHHVSTSIENIIGANQDVEFPKWWFPGWRWTRLPRSAPNILKNLAIIGIHEHPKLLPGLTVKMHNAIMKARWHAEFMLERQNPTRSTGTYRPAHREDLAA